MQNGSVVQYLRRPHRISLISAVHSRDIKQTNEGQDLSHLKASIDQHMLHRHKRDAKQKPGRCLLQRFISISAWSGDAHYSIHRLFIQKFDHNHISPFCFSFNIRQGCNTCKFSRVCVLSHSPKCRSRQMTFAAAELLKCSDNRMVDHLYEI